MTLVRALLACGLVSSAVYVVADIMASVRWVGYSYVNQAVSELSAIGAPTRSLVLAFFSAYNALVLAFAIGVWMAAAEKRSLRVASAMLVVYALVGQATLMFSPMHLRGSATSATDIGHITLTAVEVLSIVLFMAFGSGADGRWFRMYSIATIVVLMAAGILTGAVSTHMTASAASTPWAGTIERVNIYGTMLWVAVFGGVLLRAQGTRHTQAEANAKREKPVRLKAAGL